MELRPLYADLQAKAIAEINEDPSRYDEVFEHIKEWLRKQSHLNFRLDPQIQVAFYRGCKWNLQYIKEKMDTFNTIKNFVPEFYGNRDPMSNQVQNVLKSGVACILPKLKGDLGPRICLLVLSRIQANVTEVIDVTKVFFMILDILMMEDDDYVISGINVLLDYKHCPTSVLLQYTPSLVIKYIRCFQNAYPVRIKEFTCLNAPILLDSLYNNVGTHFLTKKLQQRVNILSTENTKEYVNRYPRKHLTKEYGGSNGSINDLAEQWKNKIESYRDWFIEDARYVSNEKLRQGKCKLSQGGIRGRRLI